MVLMTKEEVRKAVEELFYKFASSLSSAKWIKKFLSPYKIELGETISV